MTPRHLVDMARLCSESGGTLSSVSSMEAVEAGEAIAIRSLVGTLADRYLLRADCLWDGTTLTVIFRGRGSEARSSP